MSKNYDFCGWATRNNLKCADGRIINKDAFIDNDGMKVPLIWNHQHNDPSNVLGHAILENRDDGVYCYGYFNETAKGKDAKAQVQHGDVEGLSIFANHLKQNGPTVIHGLIREVSLVLAGANPGAYIENVIRHGEEQDDEAIIFSGESDILLHSEESASESKQETKAEETKKEDTKMADNNEKTVGDVFEEFTDEQKKVVYFMIAKAIEEEQNKSKDTKEDGNMKHNLFQNDDAYDENVLTHSDIEEIFSDGKRYGSLKDSVIAHGIDNVEYLFPDEKTLGGAPEFVKRPTEWVDKFMKGVSHSPFSRIKTRYADITEDEARALGYIKGNMKKEEFFGVAKRSTTPTTIYKKQKLDRDDVIDITDFDVVSWMKTEMRIMLNEEIARAALVGDGRPSSSDDKISEQNIRPIWTDDDVFTVKKVIEFGASDSDDAKSKKLIKTIIKSRKDYKGSGNPVLVTTEDILTDMLLMEDTTGRVIYDTIDKLKTALRVADIITCPVVENQTRTVGADTHTLLAILVNFADYNIGADKGGEVNMFDDFDIDYNAMKYLIETRCSGALVKPYSAIAFESKPSA